MVPAIRRFPVVAGVCLALSGLFLAGCASSELKARRDNPVQQTVERAKIGDGGALQKLHEAAASGEGAAAYAIGLGLAEGWAGPRDMGQALAWWQRAADQGDADAMNALGVAYAEGIGLPQSTSRARLLWEQAAAQGHPTAQYNLGSLLVSAAETRGEMADAAEWLRRSAEQGDPDAEYFLANLYDSGEGVPRQPMEALRLWREAAARGHPEAAYSLGEAYLSGNAVPVDVGEAQRWMRRAADNGHAGAVAALALLAGGGVPEPTIIARRGRGLPSRVASAAPVSEAEEAESGERTEPVQRSEPLAQPRYKAPEVRAVAAAAPPAPVVARKAADTKGRRATVEKGKNGKGGKAVAVQIASRVGKVQPVLGSRDRPSSNSGKGKPVMLADRSAVAKVDSVSAVRAKAATVPAARPTTAVKGVAPVRQVAANATAKGRSDKAR